MRCGGALLVAPLRGLTPAVATLGEALGGGVTSVAAVLFDTRIFGRVTLPSSATMVNDNLSSHVALSVLDCLDGMPDAGRTALAI